MAAFCVVNDIEAVIMPSGVFGTVAFLHLTKDVSPEETVKRLTTSVKGLDAVLAQFKMGKIETALYHDGKFQKELVPTLVLGNLTDAAEDALIGELDLFELIQTGKAHVNSEHALAHLPSNFIPKKYQKKPKSSEDIPPQDFQAFYTKNMPLDVAKATLKRFES
ncbi:MAG: hypothetical protein LBC50_00565 [Candidatus Ancillula sp.]|nr:hypothetical protein [Candidatus Ancillula sp.]